MKAKTVGKIVIPVVSVLSLLAVAATVAANIFPATLDAYLGRGERHVSAIEGTENWDTNFYEADYKDKEEAVTEGNKIAVRVAEEGDILLKNDSLLPLEEKSKVMPFGYGYLNPCYGQYGAWGGGKPTSSDRITPEQTLKDNFTIDNTAVKKMREATAEKIKEADGTMSVTPFRSNSTMVPNIDATLLEYNPSIYSGISHVDNTTAVVFITRWGEEGSDRKYDGYTDGTKHYYDLSANELGTIKEAKRICDKVVVIINSSNVMEVDEIATKGSEYEADAIIYVGAPGEVGFTALGEILNGKVNPSAKTPDIWPSDFTKDPSYANIGQFYYTIDGVQDSPYCEYQEDMYMGYRFYETANDIGASGFTYGKTSTSDGAIQEKGRVNYPFGYGLSYTTFEKTLDDVSYSDGKVNIKVTVKNKGSKEGKDVVELYYTSPYTDFDQKNGIEKPTVTLMAFDKTDILKSGDSQTFEFSIEADEMASYCSKISNKDGSYGCYLLEGGEYSISLRENSHDVIASKTINVAETIYYNNGNLRSSDKLAQSELDDEGNSTGHPIGWEYDSSKEYQDVSNLFADSTNYMNGDVSTHLSRNNWNETLPVADVSKVVRTKELPEAYATKLKAFQNFNYETDPYLGNVEGSVVYNPTEYPQRTKDGLKVSDLRGLKYDDPLWDTLLDQISWTRDKQNILRLFSAACYTSAEIESIGLMATVECDGANGLKFQSGDNPNTATVTWEMEPVLGATWNEDLMYEVGEQEGNESLVLGVQSQYAPGLNLHRTQFNARNHCYFSEDPLLTGKLGARMISGMADKGLVSAAKHFALNEQDTNRDQECHVWASEQCMRELYFRAFEIAFKEARATEKFISDTNGTLKTRIVRAAKGTMTTQTCIGWYWGHANYAFLQQMLRGEWGFRGFVISDWLDTKKSNRDMALRGGCDLYLASNSNYQPEDYTSSTARWRMREAIHNICYAMTNSNATNHAAPGSTIFYDTSPWHYWLIALDCGVGAIDVGLLAWFVVTLILNKKAKKEDK